MRDRIRTLLAARAQREADAEASAKLAAAMEARVKQRGTLPPDTYAMRAYELRPLAECYPDTFDLLLQYSTLSRNGVYICCVLTALT